MRRGARWRTFWPGGRKRTESFFCPAHAALHERPSSRRAAAESARDRSPLLQCTAARRSSLGIFHLSRTLSLPKNASPIARRGAAREGERSGTANGTRAIREKHRPLGACFLFVRQTKAASGRCGLVCSVGLVRGERRAKRVRRGRTVQVSGAAPAPRADEVRASTRWPRIPGKPPVRVPNDPGRALPALRRPGRRW